MEYDLVILGGGPAGLTAAIYAGRYNLKTAVISNNFGGTANLAGEVENWPGIIGSGIEIMKTVKEQAEKFGAEFLSLNITSVKKDGEIFIIQNEKEEIRAKSIIVALGTQHRKLGVSGEGKFLGKGVTYCAICDGNFFRGKTVSVIGGGRSASRAALYLSDICEKVYVIYRKGKLRCEPIECQRLESKENVEFVYNSNVTEIIGENFVQKIKVLQENPGEEKQEKEIELNGVFIEIGADPSIVAVKDLGLELKGGYIVTDKNCKTNVKGVFAAGDITDNNVKQMINASGEGAVAAMSAYDYLIKK